MIQLDIERFIKEYWQKKPLLIRQGLPQFDDPLDEHDLAGLAQYPEVDSRIISQDNQLHWDVTQGPIEDFESVCKDNWSLLVRGVNEYLQEAAYILDEFNFIPNWRVDDLMVSFSVANAGVGPHLDQYDVFIIQGKGSRNWKVGDKGNFTAVKPHPCLSQIEPFTPIIDEVLYPGDIIYIPPGFPHDGVALEDCLNYSVGFRAPEQSQLLDSFASYLLEHEIKTHRYTDPDIMLRSHSAEIKQAELQRIKSLMQEAIDSPCMENWLLSFASDQNKDIDEEDEPVQLTQSEAEHQFAQATYIEKSADTIAVFMEQDSTQSTEQNQLSLALNGQAFEYQGEEWEIDYIKSLLSSRQSKITAQVRKSEQLNAFITALLINGMWEVIVHD